MDLCSKHATLVALLAFSTTVESAPIDVRGAIFERPDVCQAVDGALVCKLGDQQFELFVNRKAQPSELANESFARRMEWFADVHQAAVTSIMKSTGNEDWKAFGAYGKYPAQGSVLTHRTSPTAPVVQLATVLHNGDVWEFLEVVQKRTPAVETLAQNLQRSLRLPGDPDVVKPPPVDPAMPVVGHFVSKRLTFQYLPEMTAVIEEDTPNVLRATVRHQSRPGGPSMSVTLRSANAKTPLDTSVAERKSAAIAAIDGQHATVDVNQLGTLKGRGFALLGVPLASKGLSGVESLQTVFLSEVKGAVLELRLTTEQRYARDAESLWALLGQSLRIID
ncbi:MAG: hypothetical protein JNL19_12140 [Burkholderiales bacterium]|nr:hypothetical protein [Burkholderiales bacterium]